MSHLLVPHELQAGQFIFIVQGACCREYWQPFDNYLFLNYYSHFILDVLIKYLTHGIICHILMSY